MFWGSWDLDSNTVLSMPPQSEVYCLTYAFPWNTGIVALLGILKSGVLSFLAMYATLHSVVHREGGKGGHLKWA